MLDEDATQPLSPAEALTALASIVLGDTSFDAVLQRAAEVTKATIPGAVEVSVTMRNDHLTTVASSGQLASDVDESQYAAGFGPCLDAIRLGETMIVDDQTTETRWPEYSPRAAAAGVRSSVAVPLSVDGIPVGALNIYGTQPHSFDAPAVRAAQDLAAYAGIVLNNARLYFTAATEASQLAEAMRSRADIEQAKGILMGTRHCDADEAFDTLVRLSQQSGRKLRDVAAVLVRQAAAG